MIEIIQAIQKAKTFLNSSQSLSIEQRKTILLSLAQAIRDLEPSLLEILKVESGLPMTYIQEWILKPAEFALESASQQLQGPLSGPSQHSPTGVTAIHIEVAPAFRFVFERLAPAIAAGNAVVLNVKDPEIAKLVKTMLLCAKVPGELVAVFSEPDETQRRLLIEHPGISAVVYVGNNETGYQYLRWPGLVGKKIQFSLSASNSAILVGDTWTEEQLSLLVQACFVGQGQHPWSINKIYIAEKFVGDFLQRFQMIADKLLRQTEVSLPRHGLQPKVDQLKAEGAKVAFELETQGCVLIDLPHCSSAQQESLGLPIILLSGVKYIHEAAKWANTGHQFQVALVLGENEKALKLAEKLEAGTIFINKWLQDQSGIIHGGQKSVVGDSNYEVFGSFYSNRKNIVT